MAGYFKSLDGTRGSRPYPREIVRFYVGTPLQAGRYPSRSVAVLLNIIAVWFALNVSIPLVIIYQRSPSLRHRIHKLVLSWVVFDPQSRHRLQLAHVLVDASHFDR